MNIVLVINVLVGVYFISINEEYLVTSFQLEGSTEKCISSVVDIKTNTIYYFKNDEIERSSNVEFLRKDDSETIELIERKFVKSELVIFFKCDIYNSKQKVKYKFLGHENVRTLYIKEYVAEIPQFLEFSKNILSSLPFIEMNESLDGKFTIKSVECNPEFVESVLIFEVAEIGEIPNFTTEEKIAISKIGQFVDRS